MVVSRQQVDMSPAPRYYVSLTPPTSLYPCISRPPVPWMTSPVKYEPIGEARKTYATATSIGMPGLINGASDTPRESIASAGLPFVAGWSGVQLSRELGNSSCESVSRTYMIPGATALTLIPCGACCCAKLLVKIAIAPFVEL